MEQEPAMYNWQVQADDGGGGGTAGAPVVPLATSEDAATRAVNVITSDSDNDDSGSGIEDEEEQSDSEAPAVSDIIIPDDPALWPGKLSDRERCDIVIKGPVQVRNYVFPKNNENPPRKFTTRQYENKLENGESVTRK